jgi:hypothetical protein
MYVKRGIISKGLRQVEYEKCRDVPDIENNEGNWASQVYDFDFLKEMVENEEKYFLKSYILNSRMVQVRTRIVDWVIKFGYAYELSSQTILLAIKYFDAVTQTLNLQEKNLQLIASCSLWIASKYHEGDNENQTSNHLSLDACYYGCSRKFKKEDFVFCEKIILNALQFSLTRVTPLEFFEFSQKFVPFNQENFEHCIVRTSLL